ncbi:type II secretion system secretin GspD [Polymorphobacter sp. PAMC 29334]|uniref:type II secretion system secretin GspD n=1 Tax=Polymorphobacter sp. PAMC 29334 TaxID=2862331 RepID=UPI001D012243|nr:type II secretion system secretin GspD [Polymorphobacter sp. PAMC 29334]
MGRNKHRAALSAAIGALVALPGVAAAQAAPQVPARVQANDVIVNMRDVEIAQVAEQVSRITGRTLILDPSVKGVVNVVSAEPLSADGVWDLFRSVLRVYGFAAVKSGAAWRIVPQASAIQGGATAASGRNVARSQDVVTRVVPLRNLPADSAVRVFRPLVASFGSIEPLANPNAIVVTDYAENVRRIERLAQDLDAGGGASFESLPLKYASAKDVGAALARIMGDGTAPGSPKIALDERSNVILIRGDARSLSEARRMAVLLDKPGGAAPTTRVFRLNFADAESITDVLRGLTGGGQQRAATNPVARSLSRSRSSIGAGSTFSTSSSNGSSGANGGQGSFGALGGQGGLNGGGATTGSTIAALTGGLTASGGGGTTPVAGVQADDLSIQPAPELNAIVVRGTPAAIAAIGVLIEELDIRRPQVLIEAAIAEVTGDAAEALGVQFAAGGAAVINGVSGGTSFSNTGVSLGSVIAALVPGGLGLVGDGLSLAGGSKGNFNILVQALGTSTKSNLLSTPSITTLDNEPAEIVVGQNVPFRTGSFSTTGNTLTPFTTIERQDVGITLRIVPRIHEGDSIRLEVSQEVSSLVGSVTGAADLITNRRSIQTTVLADNGDTIVLGGLITDDRTNTRSQVPVLGDIPVLGNLFKSRQQTQTKRTLFVFLRPTILRDRASVVAAAKVKYDRLRAQEAGDPDRSILLHPPAPRLPLEIQGIY